MKYQEVTLHIGVDELDSLSLLLEGMGITGLVVNDPRELTELMEHKEAYHWDYIDESVIRELSVDPSITFYADEGRVTPALLEKLKPYRIEVRTVDDQDWLHRWKDYFDPAPITERFVVKPAWCDYDAAQGEYVIDMDPGMAFGTGTHATTRLCLKLMENYLVPGTRVLDIGTGTGILAIAAAMLGSGEVLALDIDPQAVEVARENIRKNAVEKRVRVHEADLTKGVDFQADIVVANLMADLVIRLSQHVQAHMTPGGVFISSGIIEGKESAVCEMLESLDFQILDTLHEGEWWAIAAKRR